MYINLQQNNKATVVRNIDNFPNICMSKSLPLEKLDPPNFGKFIKF